jgi:hypothetical protein
VVWVLQGTTPVTLSYQLTITSPVYVKGSTTISFLPSMLSVPSGITNAQALTFISFSPSTLTFTQASQPLTVTVSFAVPTAFAGDYGYKINTTGWPAASGDLGCTVNVNTNPPASTSVAPQITLTPADGTVYTAAVGATSYTIPITYAANVQTGTGLTSPPITSTTVSVNGTPVSTSVTAGALGTVSIGGSASYVATSAGTYTISASAVNTVGTALVTHDVTVVFPAAPAGIPPTITANSPLNNPTYNYTLGSSTPVSVPVSFTVVSPSNPNSGPVTGVSATLLSPSGTTSSVALGVTGVGSAMTVTPTATLPVTAPGGYTLTYTGTNAYGTVSTSVNFTVAGVTPVPSITVATSSPTYQIPANASSVSVPYTLSGATTYGTITAVTASLTGPSTSTKTTMSPTLSAYGSATISGSGTLTITAPGTYTINATDTNSGSMSASASTTFTVTQVAGAETVTWLPPVSCGQPLCGGSVIPVQFKVSKNGAFVSDTSIVVAIYQVYSNGTSSTPVIYTYNSSNNGGCSWSGCNGGGWWGWWGGCGNGSCSNNNYGCGNWNSCGWNACTTYYSIGSTSLTYKMYFPTDTGANTYRIEVYTQTGSSASSIQVLGTATVTTATCGTCYDNNGNQCKAQDDNWGNCNVQSKCWGNYRSGSCSWGGNGCYGNSDSGGCTNNWGYNGSSCNKSRDNNSCLSNNWGGWGR